MATSLNDRLTERARAVPRAEPRPVAGRGWRPRIGDRGPRGPIVRIVLGFPGRRLRGDAQAGRSTAELAAAGIDARPAYGIEARIPTFVADAKVRPLPDVANVIAVASGKGGVGKSTVAANLALALAAQGARTGLLDADIYGPSMPRMMGLTGVRPTTADGKTLDPPRGHGLPVMSIGFLVDADQPMAWRGPMVTQALTQMLSDTALGRARLPRGGHAAGHGRHPAHALRSASRYRARSSSRRRRRSRCWTRARACRCSARSAYRCSGIVENMGLHRCPACGHESHVFDAGGGARAGRALWDDAARRTAARRRDPRAGGFGRPTVVADPASPVAAAFHAIARRAAGALAVSAIRGAVRMPNIRIEDER